MTGTAGLGEPRREVVTTRGELAGGHGGRPYAGAEVGEDRGRRGPPLWAAEGLELGLLGSV